MKEELFTYLRTQIGEDQDTLDMLFSEYKATLEQKLGQISPMLEQGSLEELRPIAHSLKGDTAIVGDTTANRAAVAFEAAVKSGLLAESRQLFAELQACLKQLE